MAKILTVTSVRQALLRLAAATALVAVPFTLVEGGMEAAHAACTPVVTNNATVTCTFTTTGPIGTGVETGVTLTVQNLAIVNAAVGGNGVNLGTSANVTVDGTARTLGANERALVVGANSTVVINGALRVQGNSANGVFAGSGTTITLGVGSSATDDPTSTNATIFQAGSATTINLNESVNLSSNASTLVGAGRDAVINVGDASNVRTLNFSGRGRALISVGLDSQVNVNNGATLRNNGFGGALSNSAIDAQAGTTININAGSTVAREDITSLPNRGAISIISNGIGASGNFATINVSGTVDATTSNLSGIILQNLNASQTSTATIHIRSGGIVTSMGTAIVDNSPQALSTTVILEGTLSSAGVLAAELGSGDDVFELRNGYTITNNRRVDGGAGGAQFIDRVALGGSVNFSFDAGLVTSAGVAANGEQFTNFERIVKRGTNTVQLTASRVGVGTVEVEAGTLDLRNDMASANFLVLGGRLETAANLNINLLEVSSGGTVSPGGANAAVDLNAGGNIVFNAGSTYEVSLSAASQNGSTSTSDRIITATGNLILNGGSVVPVDINGAADYAATETFTILQGTAITRNTGSGAAEFDTIVDNSALVDYTLSYTGTTVELTRIIVNPVTVGGSGLGGSTVTVGGRVVPDFRVPANTFNNYQAANGLITYNFASDTSVMGALLPLSTVQLNNAYQSLTALAQAEATAAAASGSRNFSELLVSVAVGDGSVSSATLGGQTSLGAVAAGSSAEFDTARYGADLAAASFGPTVWLGALGGYSDLAFDGNAAGYDAATFGLAGGIDNSFDGQSRIGAAFGYTQTNVDVSNDLQEAVVRSAHIGLYGSTGADRLEEGFAARGAVSYSHHWVETERNIRIGTAINRTAESDYDGNTFSGDVEVKYNFAVDLGASSTTILAPFARARFGRSQFASYTETGAGLLGLTGQPDDYNSSALAVGVAFAGDFNVGGAIWKPTLSVAYERLLGDEGGSATSNFIGSPTAFQTLGATESRDRVRIGSVSEFAINDTMSLTFATDSVYSEDRTDISAKGGIKVQF